MNIFLCAIVICLMIKIYKLELQVDEIDERVGGLESTEDKKK